MSAGTQSRIENPTTAIEAVKLLVGSQSAPRLAMQGRSMLPLLHEPMVLELAPAGRLRVGDIVVFEDGGKLVAHRVTKLGSGALQTCGDARPWAPEHPAPGSIVGKVKAVRAHSGENAPVVDTAGFRIRGAIYGRTRAARALPFRCMAFARRLSKALPWRRERPYAALVEAMSASLRGDDEAFQRALNRASASAFAATARRHGCAATLLEALRLHDGPQPQAAFLRGALRAQGRQSVVMSLVAKSNAASLASVLAKAEIPFALLKGAARLYADEPDATLHASGDFDVLVPTDRLAQAIAALRSQGYDERRYADVRDRYLAHHHHAAPLFPPGFGFAVELHTSLAPPGDLSTRLDWEALRGRMRSCTGPAGEVLVLDRVGAALHLAVHAIGQRRLRDSLLLARLLGAMSEGERAELIAIAAQERIDPIRLRASFALGARLAGVTWPSDRVVERYLEWTSRREDVPLFFAQRSQLAEGWYAAGGKMTRLALQLVDSRSGLDEEPGARTAWRVAGRVLASGVAFGYAGFMPGTR
ncbi:MAG TPA: nucleotidyltransferase family protein [Candidatus Acidoferrales bacterium]|nr:nucleotidyltransferase family protein [Candidatus Acidoferrales bacterium]